MIRTRDGWLVSRLYLPDCLVAMAICTRVTRSQRDHVVLRVAAAYVAVFVDLMRSLNEVFDRLNEAVNQAI